MKRFIEGIAIMIVLCVSAPLLYAHICHSIFKTPGLLAVRPEKDVSTLSKSDEFKVYAQNNYQAPLTNIKLFAETEDLNVDVKVTPGAVSRLRPGERGEFTVNISVKDTKQRDFAIKFSVTAKQLKMRPVEEPTDQELRNVWKYLALGAGQTIAAEALSRRGYADALEFVKAVIRKDPTTTIRLKPEECAGRAARYVGRMKRNELAPYLRERYNVESSSWIRGNILLGLAALGQEEDKKIFSQAADGKDEFIRYSALLALAMTGDKPAAEKLEAGMESSDGRIMLISAWGQGIVKNPKAIKLLEDVVDKKGSKSYVLPPLPGDVKTHTTGGNLDYCMRILAGDALLDLAVRNQ